MNVPCAHFVHTRAFKRIFISEMGYSEKEQAVTFFMILVD